MLFRAARRFSVSRRRLRGECTRDYSAEVEDDSEWARYLARVVAPYVPTPQQTVDTAVGALQLTPSDVFYDLGCGDGRAVLRYVVLLRQCSSLTRLRAAVPHSSTTYSSQLALM